MEVSNINELQYDEDKALNSLLDAFGSVFSLNDIASAYCEAGRNPDLAGQILYMKYVPLPNGSYPGTKSMKLDSKEMSTSLLSGDGLESSSRNEDRLHKDMEDFLFKMLGQGFRLQRDVIREVLVRCGYNMQKSMENLLELSVAGSKKDNKSLSESKKVRPENFEELHGREMRSSKRPIALGKITERPRIDVSPKPKINRVHAQEDEDGEDSFQALRRVVKEYRGTMKEYYKDAVDAFAKGDEQKANKLLEQGQVFRKKARQADEESNQKIFLTGNTETETEMLLELHDHGPKEAIQLLKCHLTSLAGIPSFKYLKIIVDTDEQDSSKGIRRRLIMKLLKRESISWNEGENSGILLIRLDKLDPKSLSFAKK